VLGLLCLSRRYAPDIQGSFTEDGFLVVGGEQSGRCCGWRRGRAQWLGHAYARQRDMYVHLGKLERAMNSVLCDTPAGHLRKLGISRQCIAQRALVSSSDELNVSDASLSK